MWEGGVGVGEMGRLHYHYKCLDGHSAPLGVVPRFMARSLFLVVTCRSKFVSRILMNKF